MVVQSFLTAHAGSDVGLTRMALCRDSWLDWSKKDPAKLKRFGESFRANFLHKNNDAFVTPRMQASIAGLRVVQVYPDSIGMAVGFSVLVSADVAKTRVTIEKMLGRKLTHCETGDGIQACDLRIGEQRTFTLMAEDDTKSRQTLVGCYYYYEK